MNGSPHACVSIAREVDFELGVPVAAILEAEGLELVRALIEIHVFHLNMSPQIARRVLSAIDADEASAPKVSVVADVDRLLDVNQQRDANMERDILCCTPLAYVMIRQHGRRI